MESAKVLIVEDEGIVARDLQRTLKGLGYSVDNWAATGEEGIEITGKDHPDLVLMDIHLGKGINGIEAATQIRERFQTPVIFLTAYSDGPTLELAKRSQPYGYILKPFDENELRTNIEVTLYRHRIERELNENRRFLSELISHFPGFVYRCQADEGMKLTFISDGIQKVSGYSPEELLDRSTGSWDFIRHPEDRDSLFQEIQAAVKSRRSFEAEYRILDRQGDIRWVLEKGELAEVKGQTEVEGFVVDITERKKTEQIQYRNQKLEGLGRLAGGIAHAFNNYLMTVISGLYLIKQDAEGNSEILRRAEILERESERARLLTQSLLTFSRGGDPVFVKTSAIPILKETARLVPMDPRTMIVFSVPEDLPEIEADEGQIGRVFHALLENAAESMPEGGTIRVEAGPVLISADQEPFLEAGEYVEIKIRDTGNGIPSGNRDKIFEPFFTTKGSQNGLGLAAAYSILKKHRGSIRFEENSGPGTTFFVYLPVFSGGKGAEAEKPSAGLQGKRILFMDDEPHIQTVLREIMTRMGLTVETCAEGEEAVRIYKENKEAGRPFDCVILDLTVIHGMGGEVAVNLIREFDPEARVIASSGYSKGPVMGNFQKFGFCGVLPKPYLTEQLKRVLERVLSD